MPLIQYQPLSEDPESDEIRLVDLQPRRHRGITLTIRHVRLQDNPGYEALSYVWGPSTCDFAITCNGQHQPTRRNLYHALERLQPTDIARTLWIDVLCINQADEGEKSRQVRLMSRIYAECTRVIAWLGEPDDETGLVFDFLPILLKAEENRRGSRDEVYHRELWNGIDFPHVFSYAHHYRALFHLLNRPWFRRIWITQEISLAPSAAVMCGPYETTWDDLVRAVAFLYKANILRFFAGEHGYVDGCWALEAARQSIKMDEPRPLLQNLLLFRGSDCTDPRDKVFALCGISNDIGPGQLNINIDYSLPTKKVYTDFAIAHMRAYNSLEVLSAARGRAGSKIEDLSTWVPDWTVTTQMATLRRTEFPSIPAADGFRASRRSTYNCNTNGNTLLAGASQIDQLAEIGPIWDLSEYLINTSHMARFDPRRIGRYWSRAFSIIMAWSRACRPKNQHPTVPDYIYPFTGQPKWLAFAITFYGGHPVFAAKVYGAMWQRFTLRQTVPFFFFRFGFAKCDVIFGIVWLALEGRRMGSTQKGYTCLLPQAAAPGDSVVILKGGDIPYILRRGSDTWEFIGEAYVHGIMGGGSFYADDCQEIGIE
ncbi:hypothetical protein MRS44_003959 [Fusarium solani]|uniref:uncharacterized protein n=1 Tax=Fusarium solani TaxID=169388 RepID=UPI0032C44524|nr:hypothetical protein MRS44_003959 [Fusarium solani]